MFLGEIKAEDKKALSLNIAAGLIVAVLLRMFARPRR
jgi:hypothetical protein